MEALALQSLGQQLAKKLLNWHPHARLRCSPGLSGRSIDGFPGQPVSVVQECLAQLWLLETSVHSSSYTMSIDTELGLGAQESRAGSHAILTCSAWHRVPLEHGHISTEAHVEQQQKASRNLLDMNIDNIRRELEAAARAIQQKEYTELLQQATCSDLRVPSMERGSVAVCRCARHLGPITSAGAPKAPQRRRLSQQARPQKLSESLCTRLAFPGPCSAKKRAAIMHLLLARMLAKGC